MVEDATGSGRLVAFEGIDGCGKSTQVARCADWLRSRSSDRPVRIVREPGGTPFGEQLRELLLRGPDMGAQAETLLYMASRAELYEHVVLPALEEGEIVLLDRSYYSTAAYQGAAWAWARTSCWNWVGTSPGGANPTA